MSNALAAAEQALLSGDEDKLYEALKAMDIQNLQAQNKGWYLKQLQAERESKEVCVCVCSVAHMPICRLSIISADVSHQASTGEALTKEELQAGVDVANEVAEGYTKSTSMNHLLDLFVFSSFRNVNICVKGKFTSV